jgi:zinc transport system substrate-binding protein
MMGTPMKKYCLILLFALIGCTAPVKKNLQPVVLVTIPPYAYFVKAIAGDLVTTEIFVPPGANPHTYEPTPKQVEQFAKAEVWFRFGDPIEEKILPFLREKKVQDINLTTNIKLLPYEQHDCHADHHHEGDDPHVWLDPLLAITQVCVITDELKKLFPEKQDVFTNNSEQLIQQLEQLNSEIVEELTPFQGNYLLLSHPALGYYCARYGLHQLSVECDGKEPRPQQIAEIVREATDHEVRMVLTEPQYNNKGAMLIAQKLDIPVYQIDPYAEEYFDMMRQITKLILQNYDEYH